MVEERAGYYHIFIFLTRDNTLTQTYHAAHNTLEKVMADFEAVTRMSEALTVELVSSAYVQPRPAVPETNMMLHRWVRPTARRWRPW